MNFIISLLGSRKKNPCWYFHKDCMKFINLQVRHLFCETDFLALVPPAHMSLGLFSFPHIGLTFTFVLLSEKRLRSTVPSDTVRMASLCAFRVLCWSHCFPLLDTYQRIPPGSRGMHACPDPSLPQWPWPRPQPPRQSEQPALGR